MKTEEIYLAHALVSLGKACDLDALALADHATRLHLPARMPIAQAVGSWFVDTWILFGGVRTEEAIPGGFSLCPGDLAILDRFWAALGCNRGDEMKARFIKACHAEADRIWWRTWDHFREALAWGKEAGEDHVETWLADWRQLPVLEDGSKPTKEQIKKSFLKAIDQLHEMGIPDTFWGHQAEASWATSKNGRRLFSEEVPYLLEQIRFWFVLGFQKGAGVRSLKLAQELTNEMTRLHLL